MMKIDLIRALEKNIHAKRERQQEGIKRQRCVTTPPG